MRRNVGVGPETESLVACDGTMMLEDNAGAAAG